MNYTERAKQLGFSAAAVMDTKNLVFKPEYRVFCEENRCGNYDRILLVHRKAEAWKK